MANKILVVDDEPDLAKLYQLVLKMSGFDVRAATSGRQALALYDEDRPDLVLLDVMMPSMDGIEVCRELRVRCSDPEKLVIIMYTANDSSENREASREAGANELVSKDVPVEMLSEKINNYLAASVL